MYEIPLGPNPRYETSTLPRIVTESTRSFEKRCMNVSYLGSSLTWSVHPSSSHSILEQDISCFDHFNYLELTLSQMAHHGQW